MQYIEPITSTIEDVSVTEADADAYNPATTYAASVQVMTGHKLYQSLQADNTGHDPATSPDWWLYLGATNAYRMVDEFIYTQTEDDDEIDVTVGADWCDCVALFALAATSVVLTLTDNDTEEEVWTETVDLQMGFVSDLYEYFFSPITFATSLVRDIPNLADSSLRIQAIKTGETAKIGNIVVGRRYDLGRLLMGVTTGIMSFSKVDRDDYGRVTVVQGKSARRLRGELRVPSDMTDLIDGRLASLDGRAIVFIGDDRDNGGFASLLTLGLIQDYDTIIKYPTYTIFSFDIEGII